MKSNGAAENRRALDELTNAYKLLEERNRLLEDENRRLREQLHRDGPKSVQLARVEVVKEIQAGNFVEWVDKFGMAHRALVLQVLDNGFLKIKVYRNAMADEVKTAKPLAKDGEREGWKRRQPVGRRA